MAFNYHSVIKAPLRMNEVKLDFQLPKIPIKATDSRNLVGRDSSSLRSNKKANSHPKQVKKSASKNEKTQRGLIAYPKIKQSVQQSHFNKQNKNLTREKQKNLIKMQIKPKSLKKSKIPIDQSNQLSVLFWTISNTISGSQDIKCINKTQGPLDYSRAKKMDEKYLKRSILARKKYQINRSQIIGQKTSLKNPTINVLQDLEHHMSTLFDLEEQNSNSLKQLVENRGILENLREIRAQKKKVQKKV